MSRADRAASTREAGRCRGAPRSARPRWPWICSRYPSPSCQRRRRQPRRASASRPWCRRRGRVPSARRSRVCARSLSTGRSAVIPKHRSPSRRSRARRGNPSPRSSGTERPTAGTSWPRSTSRTRSTRSCSRRCPASRRSWPSRGRATSWPRMAQAQGVRLPVQERDRLADVGPERGDEVVRLGFCRALVAPVAGVVVAAQQLAGQRWHQSPKTLSRRAQSTSP